MTLSQCCLYKEAGVPFSEHVLALPWQKHLPKGPSGVESSLVLPEFLGDVLGTEHLLAAENEICARAFLWRLDKCFSCATSLVHYLGAHRECFTELQSSPQPGHQVLQRAQRLQNYPSICRIIGHFGLTKIDVIFKAPFQ